MPEATRHLFFVSLFGALAGLAFYVIVEVLPTIAAFDRATLVCAVFSFCFFGGALAMTGPVPLWQSLRPSAVFGSVIAALAYWASFRFSSAEAFIETGHLFFVVFVIFVISIPFLITFTSPELSHRRYTDLFDVSWAAVTRVVVSSAFTGLFWLLVFLSNALLELVGIDIIEDLIDLDGVPAVLTGAVFGLAVAVVYEMAHMISPHLILRLLRLLMPMITCVIAVFVVALPLRGLSNLFGDFSAAGVLTGMGLVATGLVSATIDRSEDSGVQRKWMKGFVQVLVLFIPILAGLACYAVYLRVHQYGWTPDRLAAGTVAGVCLAYGLVYAGAVVLRGDWGHRLRQGNIMLALGVVGVLALWLTPVLNPQALSSASQMARLDEGTPLDKLPLFDMSHDWGFAGKAAVAELDDRYKAVEDSAALALLDKARSADGRFDFNRRLREDADAQRLEAFEAMVTVYPDGTAMQFDPTSDYLRYQIFDACLTEDNLSKDDCVWINVGGQGGSPAHAVLFAELGDGPSKMWLVGPDGAIDPYVTIDLGARGVRDLRAGRYQIGPPSWQSVIVDGQSVHAPPWDKGFK